jgi:hypothetical protein
MKRYFVVACVLALALALGLSTSAGASIYAEASAKPAKKGKGCKAKGKAGKSAAASAKPKKGKKKPCKAKGKSKPKDKGGDDTTPTPAPPAAAPFGDGAYADAVAKLDLNVSSGASTVVIKYVPPGGCVTINYTSQPVTLTKSGDTWTASETRAFSVVGEPANVKWDLTVKEPGLTYALNLTLESTWPVVGLCKWEGHPTGTLVKTG